MSWGLAIEDNDREGMLKKVLGGGAVWHGHMQRTEKVLYSGTAP